MSQGLSHENVCNSIEGQHDLAHEVTKNCCRLLQTALQYVWPPSGRWRCYNDRPAHLAAPHPQVRIKKSHQTWRGGRSRRATKHQTCDCASAEGGTTKDLQVQGRHHSARIATLSSITAEHTTFAGKVSLRVQDIAQNCTFAWRSLPMCRYLH